MTRLVDRSAEYCLYSRWSVVEGGRINSGVLDGKLCIWLDRINPLMKDGKEHLVSYPYEVIAEFEESDELIRAISLFHKLISIGNLCHLEWFI